MSFPPAQCHLYLFSLGNFEIEELFWRKGSGGGMGSRWVFLFFFLEVRGISSWGGGILCVPVGPLRRAELRAACDPGGAASAGLGAGMATGRRCWKAEVKRSAPRGRIGGSCWQRAERGEQGAAQRVPARLREEGPTETRGG